MKYSKTTNGFYDESIHTSEQIPADAVDITAAEHTALLTAQSQGQVIQADANGKPVAVTVVLTLAQTKDAKKDEIRAAYEIDANLPVTVGTVVYQGGFDSAIKLDAAKRLAEAAGLTSVTFYDATNNAHVLNFTDAQAVVVAVATAFQIALARKQAALLQVDDPATNTKTKVNAIVY